MQFLDILDTLIQEVRVNTANQTTTAGPSSSRVFPKGQPATGGQLGVLITEIGIFTIIGLLVAGWGLLQWLRPRHDIGRKWIAINATLWTAIIVVGASIFETLGTFTFHLSDGAIVHLTRVVANAVLWIIVVHLSVSGMEIYNQNASTIWWIVFFQQLFIILIEFIVGPVQFALLSLVTLGWVAVLVVVIVAYPYASQSHSRHAASRYQFGIQGWKCKNGCVSRLASPLRFYGLFSRVIGLTLLFVLYMFVNIIAAALPFHANEEIVREILYLMIRMGLIIVTGLEYIYMDEHSAVAQDLVEQMRDNSIPV